jgi:hypothetical protein
LPKSWPHGPFAETQHDFALVLVFGQNSWSQLPNPVEASAGLKNIGSSLLAHEITINIVISVISTFFNIRI